MPAMVGWGLLLCYPQKANDIFVVTIDRRREASIVPLSFFIRTTPPYQKVLPLTLLGLLRGNHAIL